jgi:hypothetical protein
MSLERVGDAVKFENPQDPTLNIKRWLNTAVTKGTPGADRYGGIRFMRLDDLAINYDNIKEVTTNTIRDTKLDFDSNVMTGSNFVMKML